ncbi:hypothetical protein PR003_g13746 [Phytophthora rubi]|uniref:Uncharacterized protein n=2 Tax=Phytophthora rubi TaxID=129364 RepID=A0A6A4F7S2_9STRA|nr:hypothetical protein PR003_g13746 [Phytophthora rubi]
MEEYDDLEEKAHAPAVVTPETPEGAIVTTTRSGGTRSLSRNLAKELDDVARPDPAYSDDDDDDYGEEKPSTKTEKSSAKPQGNRPPLNGDTPAANKILGRCLELMLKESEWVPMFAPKPVRQAVWVDLSNELAWPVNSTSTRQVADDTVSLLMAMGIEAQSYPSGLTFIHVSYCAATNCFFHIDLPNPCFLLSYCDCRLSHLEHDKRRIVGAW